MITQSDLLSIGVIRRTHYKDLPPFVFVRRDGLFVPFRSERIAELIGEEGWLLRSDVQEEEGALTWQDLVGYEVKDERMKEEGMESEWRKVGVIAEVDESTINTVATLEDGRMMPLHEDFITDIDEAAHVLYVRLPFEI
jgi:ribosomal 30S subunit maturation factor RimM